MALSLKKIYQALCIVGTISLMSQANAAAFQLWELSGVGVGNNQAGGAALASDASTSFDNPAGLTRIQGQQAVFGGVGVFLDNRFNGNVSVNHAFTQSVAAQGGGDHFLPNLYYAAPLSNAAVLGFSINTPFGLEADYGTDSALRYVNTTTSLHLYDISPALGYALNDHLSLGAGFDIQKAKVELDQAAYNPVDPSGATFFMSHNQGSDTGYGYHLGALYQFTSDSRVGLAYHSRIIHHLTGASNLTGPMGIDIFDNYTNADLIIPAYTVLSAYQKLNPKWALLGSVNYTQWNSLKNITLNNVAGPSSPFTVTIPEYFHNTWNFALGADYYLSDKVTLRSGVGYDQSPTNDDYRSVQVPDGDHYILAVGGHYQMTTALGMDLGWTHMFVKNANVNPPPQVTGPQTVSVNGTIKNSIDIYGASLTWDIT